MTATKQLTKRSVIVDLLFRVDYEVTLDYGLGHSVTGIPRLTENGVHVEWKKTDGMQEAKGATFIFFDDIAAVTYR